MNLETIIARLPDVEPNKKVAVLFTGGIKSTLVALLAKQKYGIEQLVFVNIAMLQYANFQNNPSKFEKAKKNFRQAVSKLKGKHSISLDDSIFDDRALISSAAVERISQQFGTIGASLSGYNNLYTENMKMLEDAGWDRGFVTRDQLHSYLEQHQDRYPELAHYVLNLESSIHWTSKTVAWPHIYELYNRSLTNILSDLTYQQVIDLYAELGAQDQLYATVSCENDNSPRNCGHCKNCVQRKYAFSKSRVADITKYV